MTPTLDETAIAFVDGTLDDAEREAFEARLEGDARLARRVAGHQWIARQIVAAYGPPPSDERDAALIVRLGLIEDNVLAFPARRRWYDPPRLPVGVWAGALAASLVLGLLIGNPPMDPSSPVNADMAASPALASALDTQLSGRDGVIRIGLTFRSRQGICRSFTMRDGASGLGCREDGRWVVPVIARPRDGGVPDGEYRLAGGDVAPAVMAEVDSRIVGEPLTVEQEITARGSGWR